MATSKRTSDRSGLSKYGGRLLTLFCTTLFFSCEAQHFMITHAVVALVAVVSLADSLYLFCPHFTTPHLHPSPFWSLSPVQTPGACAELWDAERWRELQGWALAPPQPAGSHALCSAQTAAPAPWTHVQILQQYVFFFICWCQMLTNIKVTWSNFSKLLLLPVHPCG